MMAHLGGPESDEAILARHERYLCEGDPQRLFTVVLGREAAPVGWVGYWEARWRDEDVWECGWHVLPSHQRRGVATAAVALVLDLAKRERRHRYVHAFPSVDNAASNALCCRLGFVLLAEADVEYPKGHSFRANDWRLDLG
jgi:RimJ/RimL family protein N-acetyltransferase